MEDISNYLVEKKVEILMEQGLKKVLSQVESLRKDVDSIKADMEMIKQKVRRMEMAPSSSRSGESGEDTQDAKEEKRAVQKKLNVSGGSGEKLNPADFAVEKIFYCAGKGKKR